MSVRQGILAVSLALCIGGTIFEPATAANWPRFRGPNGDGVASDKNIPVQWTQQNVLWKTVIPGLGNSSPIVWGDRIFLQSANDTERTLLCLDVADGKILWTQAAPGARGQTHNKNTLASSTPASDGERVYALFWDGKAIALHAYDFQGNAVWKRSLGSFTSQHGVGASPIVRDGIVYLNNDQDGSATLWAFDARSGKDVFQVPRTAFRACYSTPFFIDEAGTSELIVTSTAGISGYDPKSGAENWHWTWAFDGMALRTVGSAVYHQGIVFASSGDGKGDRHAVAVKKGAKGDVSKTNLLWEVKKNLPYVPVMLSRGDHLYFVNDKGMAGCVEARTGKSVWFERLGGANVTASPVLIDGKIYAADEKGDVFVVRAEPAYKQLAKNSVGEPVLASPAVAEGRLYIRGKSYLYCIGNGGAKR